jgi:hypothetical protein
MSVRTNKFAVSTVIGATGITMTIYTIIGLLSLYMYGSEL